MRQSPEMQPTKEPETILETRASFLGRVKERTGKILDDLWAAKGNVKELLRRLTISLQEFGITDRDLHVETAATNGIGAEATIILRQTTSAMPKQIFSPSIASSPHRLMLLGAMLTGCETTNPLEVPPHETLEAVSPKENPVEKIKVTVSGNPELDPSLIDLRQKPEPKEITKLKGQDCGPAKPADAPSECMHQQWQGFSETNPVGVAWMAIANTGTEACTATITHLELSYQPKEENTQRVLLSSGINGVQLLSADKTVGPWWGAYIYDLKPGSSFVIPANIHAYVHPFGPMIEIPEGAGELTVTFSVKLTDGCIASGGIDTYEEYATPNTTPPYTQNGSPTDFVKEAVKAPWVTKTVEPQNPVSFSINRLPRSERTGWTKDADKSVQE